MADSLIANLPPVAELTAPMEFPANVPGAPDTDGKVTGAQVRTFALAPLTLDSSGNLGAINTAAFTPISMPAHQEGLLYYDLDQKGFIAFNGESEVALNIGYENWVDVRNNTGSTITNGQAVYVSGAIGQNPTITLAQANSVSTSRLIGIATHDIENNSNGIVTSFGVVRGLNTSAFTDGALLYLSPTVAGALTATKPTAPNLVVCVGVVLHAHITQGKILVHPEVDSIAATDIYDSSVAGRSMLTAADAAAQTALLNTFTSALKGLVPASGGGTTNFLRADGSFAVPPGAGDVVGPASAVDGQVVLFNLATGKLIKAATASGVAQLSSGVLSTGNVDLTSQVTGTLPVANGGTGITSFGTGVATFLGTPSSANLAAAVTDETGSGALVFGTSPTLTTPTISGAITFPDDVRQTFNPGATNAGLNVGSIAGNPSTPSNGDLWYDSTGNALKSRINGSTVTIGSANPFFEQGLALGDLTTALTASGATVVGYYTFNRSVTLSSILFSVLTAATGAALEFDAKKNGTTIYSTKPTIDAGEFSTLTASVPQVLSTTTFAAGDVLTFFITQVGSTIAGAGPQAQMLGST